MKLMVLNIPGNNPLENLLLDEKLLYLDDDHLILRFWVNDPSVFIGYGQHAEYEINAPYIEKQNIPLLKRFSGGGTVYHDQGCLNITICKKLSPPFHSRYVDEESKFLTGLIKDALMKKHKGLKIRGINAIFVDDKKILGSSMALKNKRFLYHASLLVDVDLRELLNCLNLTADYPSQYQYVKSNKSPVCNLSMLYDTDISRAHDAILTHLRDYFDCRHPVFVTTEEQLNQLARPISFQSCSSIITA